MQRNKGAGWSQEPLPLTGASYCRLAERGNLLLCEAAAPCACSVARLVAYCAGTQTETCSSRQQHRGQTSLESREYGVKNAMCAVEGLKRGKENGIGKVECVKGKQ